LRPVLFVMATERWCRVTMVGADGDPIADGVLEGQSVPDLGTVEDLARLALVAKRLGAHLELAEVAPELVDLLELAGLTRLAVLGGPDEPVGLCVEVEREPEGGE
jgi:hypothetical protein